MVLQRETNSYKWAGEGGKGKTSMVGNVTSVEACTGTNRQASDFGGRDAGKKVGGKIKLF